MRGTIILMEIIIKGKVSEKVFLTKRRGLVSYQDTDLSGVQPMITNALSLGRFGPLGQDGKRNLVKMYEGARNVRLLRKQCNI